MTMVADVVVEGLARAAAVETAGDETAVGDYLGQDVASDGIVTLRFACLLPGYRGWAWSVDLSVNDGEPTVCESALLPGDDALLATAWVPWSDRVRPGDLEPGMVLPYIADDPRLVPGYTETGDVDADQMAIFEFGLGRARLLAPETRADVADRWHRGSHGPMAASAVASSAPCSTCAFFTPLTGSFRMMFGACTNEWSPSDGRVVSVDHGCGAHSETEAERRASEWPAPEPVMDTDAVAEFDLAAPDEEPEAGAEAEPVVEAEPEPVAEAETEPEPVVEAEPEPDATPDTQVGDEERLETGEPAHEERHETVEPGAD